MSKNIKIIIGVVIGILVIAAVGLAILLSNSKQENEEMQELFALEKEELLSEYSTFATQYDELKVRITNDSLLQKLEQEKLRTQQLLEELKQTKASDAAEIKRLKKELTTLRAVMRSYVLQIDSLNKVNAKLSKENKRAQERIQEASEQITTLNEEKEALTEKVELAAQLDALGIKMFPGKKNGKETSRVKRAKKLVVDFLIGKNVTATTGEKTVYARITAPDGSVLTKDDSNRFKFEDKEINYSIKKHIEYTGEDLPVTMYWEIEEYLQSGRYRVHIFVDGFLIGYNDMVIE